MTEVDRGLLKNSSVTVLIIKKPNSHLIHIVCRWLLSCCLSMSAMSIDLESKAPKCTKHNFKGTKVSFGFKPGEVQPEIPRSED